MGSVQLESLSVKSRAYRILRSGNHSGEVAVALGEARRCPGRSTRADGTECIQPGCVLDLGRALSVDRDLVELKAVGGAGETAGGRKPVPLAARCQGLPGRPADGKS